MISLTRVSKQYGRQLLFVDASFQLNAGEKVGLVGPNGSGKTTLFRLITGEEVADEGEVTVPRKLTIGYFRQDVEEMAGRSVLDEAILGSGRVGDLHHELEQLNHAMSDPARADDMDDDPRALRGSRGGIQPSRRLRPRGAGSRGPARPRIRRRTDRRRRRRAVRRMEDARGDGPRPPGQTGSPADGRADQPPRHRVDHLARAVPEGSHRRSADDLPRPRLHESHRHEDRRDRRRRDHDVFGELRLLRARTRDPGGEPGSRIRQAAGDAREGAAVHRAIRGARRQGGAGAEPREGAREDREDRAPEAAQGRRVRVPDAAAIGRAGGGPRRRAQDVRPPRGPRRAEPDRAARRALVRDGEERRG